MRLRLFAPLLPVLAPLFAACGDTTGFGDPLILTDTLTLAAPTAANAGVASALDILGDNAPRFPERPADAQRFDLAVRQKGGELVIAPAGALGFDSNAGISPPQDRAFAQIEEAPTASSAYLTDSTVALRVGTAHVARSRNPGGCLRFAKLEPLEIDAQQGTVLLHVVTNQRCFDTRLVDDD